MGMSKEAKNNNRMLDTEYNRVGNQYDQYGKSRENLAGQARGRADSAYGSAMSGYQNFLSRPRANYVPERGSFESRPYLQNFAQGGGVSDENAARIRGGGVFDEFSRTGGLDENTRGMMRSSALGANHGLYNSLSAELGAQNASSGIPSPGYNSQMSLLARDKSRGASDAALGAELGISDAVNKGRQWGAGSVSDSESALVDALQKGKMFGISGLGDIDKFLGAAEMDQGYKNDELNLQALGGIRGLRTDTPGEVSMYENALRDSMGQGANARGNLIGQRMSYNPNKSFLERITPLLGMAAGAAGGFINPTSTAAGRLSKRSAPAYSGRQSGFYGEQV